jgi:Family of unknown function (DUF6157)
MKDKSCTSGLNPPIISVSNMKVHTTNYTNTFIEVAEDCPATTGEIPPIKGTDKSIANIQFDVLSENPYKYTSDDVLFHCYATKNNLDKIEFEQARVQLFSKGQPCFRASPLTKRYGFGVHNNEDGKIALFGVETKEYKQFSKSKNLAVVKAMRSKKV